MNSNTRSVLGSTPFVWSRKVVFFEWFVAHDVKTNTSLWELFFKNKLGLINVHSVPNNIKALAVLQLLRLIETVRTTQTSKRHTRARFRLWIIVEWLVVSKLFCLDSSLYLCSTGSNSRSNNANIL
jgi:hypothetical protein